MTARGGVVKIICAWSPHLPPGWVRKSGQSFLEALPRVCARMYARMCVCAEADGDTVTD